MKLVTFVAAHIASNPDVVSRRSKRWWLFRKTNWSPFYKKPVESMHSIGLMIDLFARAIVKACGDDPDREFDALPMEYMTVATMTDHLKEQRRDGGVLRTKTLADLEDKIIKMDEALQPERNTAERRLEEILAFTINKMSTRLDAGDAAWSQQLQNVYQLSDDFDKLRDEAEISKIVYENKCHEIDALEARYACVMDNLTPGVRAEFQKRVDREWPQYAYVARYAAAFEALSNLVEAAPMGVCLGRYESARPNNKYYAEVTGGFRHEYKDLAGAVEEAAGHAAVRPRDMVPPPAPPAHPVDALKGIAGHLNLEIDPKAEAAMRAHYDELVPDPDAPKKGPEAVADFGRAVNSLANPELARLQGALNTANAELTARDRDCNDLELNLHIERTNSAGYRTERNKYFETLTRIRDAAGMTEMTSIVKEVEKLKAMSDLKSDEIEALSKFALTVAFRSAQSMKGIPDDFTIDNLAAHIDRVRTEDAEAIAKARAERDAAVEAKRHAYKRIEALEHFADATRAAAGLGVADGEGAIVARVSDMKFALAAIAAPGPEGFNVDDPLMNLIENRGTVYEWVHGARRAIKQLRGKVHQMHINGVNADLMEDTVEITVQQRTRDIEARYDRLQRKYRWLQSKRAKAAQFFALEISTMRDRAMRLDQMIKAGREVIEYERRLAGRTENNNFELRAAITHAAKQFESAAMHMDKLSITAKAAEQHGDAKYFEEQAANFREASDKMKASTQNAADA